MRLRPVALIFLGSCEPSLLDSTFRLPTVHPRLAAAITSLVVVLLARAAWRYLTRDRGERVLVVGSSPLTRRLMREINARPELKWLVAWLPEDATLSPADETARLAQVIRASGADRIVVGLADRRGRLPVRALLVERVRGARVEPATATFERVTGKIPIEALSAGDMVFGEGFRSSGLDRAWTRASSVVVAALGLLVGLILLPFLALAITLDSNGPVFFRHTRRGLHGRPF